MANNTYPVWNAGEDITADKLNLMLPIFAYKGATEGRASTTTLADDTDLTVTLAANAVYQIELWLFHTGAVVGSGDLKMAVNYTGTATSGAWIGTGTATTSAGTVKIMGQSWGTNVQSFGVNGGNFGDVKIAGTIFTSTSGSLVLQWSQNTSSATATNLRQGSYLKATRIA